MDTVHLSSSTCSVTSPSANFITPLNIHALHGQLIFSLQPNKAGEKRWALEAAAIFAVVTHVHILYCYLANQLFCQFLSQQPEWDMNTVDAGVCARHLSLGCVLLLPQSRGTNNELARCGEDVRGVNELQRCSETGRCDRLIIVMSHSCSPL